MEYMRLQAEQFPSRMTSDTQSAFVGQWRIWKDASVAASRATLQLLRQGITGRLPHVAPALTLC
jgi:hypothetical protein